MPKYGRSSAHFDLNLDRSNFGLSPLSLPNWYEALVLYKILTWLCPEGKKVVKINYSKRMVSLESKVEQLDKSMKDYIKLVSQSLKEQELAVQNQTKLLERSVKELHSQKVLYADLVKGTCTEVVQKVPENIYSVPPTQGPPAQVEPKTMTGMAKVFDDYLDKDRRKNNLVVHNLPESEGGPREDRLARDIIMFQNVMKETFRMSVAIARSFRVGKTVENRDRLLIIMLETPGVKQEIFRMAPQLQNSDKWGNIYVTPDLTSAEREAARKLREELVARRRAGEENLVIRRGRIIASDKSVPSKSQGSHTGTGGTEGQARPQPHGSVEPVGRPTREAEADSDMGSRSSVQQQATRN